MAKPIVFWGATGQSKVLREFIGGLGYELVALFDNDRSVPPPFADVPLYYGLDGLRQWSRDHATQSTSCLVAVGGARGFARVELQQQLEDVGLTPIVAVHPTAFVAETVTLGRGTQILANASVCAEARLGDACIVNTKASVDHECVLGRGVHIAPGATLTSSVEVGEYSLIGPGAVVVPRVRIGRHAIVGAGAVVTKDVPAGKVVFGNPARVQRDNELAREDSLECGAAR